MYQYICKNYLKFIKYIIKNIIIIYLLKIFKNNIVKINNINKSLLCKNIRKIIYFFTKILITSLLFFNIW